MNVIPSVVYLNNQQKRLKNIKDNMSLISKTIYCFWCKKAGFPEVVWEQKLPFYAEATTTCPHCAATKKQFHSGNDFVGMEYFRPDGSRIPFTDEIK